MLSARQRVAAPIGVSVPAPLATAGQPSPPPPATRGQRGQPFRAACERVGHEHRRRARRERKLGHADPGRRGSSNAFFIERSTEKPSREIPAAITGLPCTSMRGRDRRAPAPSILIARVLAPELGHQPACVRGERRSARGPPGAARPARSWSLFGAPPLGERSQI